MWLTGAKHGCSEEVHQHPLYPSGDFPFPLSRHEHSPWGSFLCPIPTGPANLCMLLPFCETKVVLPCEEEVVGLKTVSPFPSSVAKCRRGAPPLWPSFAVNPLIFPPSPSRRGYPDGGKIGLSPALQQLKDFNQARIQLECKLGQESQESAQKYDDHWIKLAQKHEKKQAKMTQVRNPTFQEVFSMASPTDLIKLLPWCVSSAVPFHYMGEALATTTPTWWVHPNYHHCTQARGITSSGSLKQSS